MAFLVCRHGGSFRERRYENLSLKFSRAGTGTKNMLAAQTFSGES